MLQSYILWSTLLNLYFISCKCRICEIFGRVCVSIWWGKGKQKGNHQGFLSSNTSSRKLTRPKSIFHTLFTFLLWDNLYILLFFGKWCWFPIQHLTHVHTATIQLFILGIFMRNLFVNITRLVMINIEMLIGLRNIVTVWMVWYNWKMFL